MKRDVERIALREQFDISRVVKGSWQLSTDHSDVGTEAAIEDMFVFVDSGINTFDCGDVYAGVEELIGRFIKERKRRNGHADDVKVLTKYIPDLSELATLEKHDVEQVIDRSLERLNVERLSMVQLGWWSYESQRYLETMGWLNELKDEGKIEQLGLANFNTDTTQEILDMGIDVVTAQEQYSILDNRAEKTYVNLCLENNISLLCYGTVAGGFLSEKWLGRPEPVEPYENRSLIKYKLIIDDIGGWELFQEILKVLKVVADKHNVSITNVATRYILERPAVAAPLIGARNLDHLDDNLRVFTFELDDEDYRILNTILDQKMPLVGDVWDLERDKDGKHGRIMKWDLHSEQDCA